MTLAKKADKFLSIYDHKIRTTIQIDSLKFNFSDNGTICGVE